MDKEKWLDVTEQAADKFATKVMAEVGEGDLEPEHWAAIKTHLAEYVEEVYEVTKAYLAEKPTETKEKV